MLLQVSDLIAGDMLRRPKSGVWHPGVYWGNGLVLHNCPSKGEHLSSFIDYAKEQVVEVRRPPAEMRSAILQRASAVLANPKQYSLLWRNCEQTFYEIIEGKAYSPTVRKAFGLVAAGTFAILTIKYRKQIARAISSRR